MGISARKPFFGVCKNKGADQPAHLRNLINTFFIRLLENIISRLATGKSSIFYLVSLAEETGLSLVLSETLNTGFLSRRGQNYLSISS